MVITFNIPAAVKCLVKEDQKVDFETFLFEKKTESIKTINVAKKLNIDPSKIFYYLKKLVGEEVKKDEILAEKKELFSNIKIQSAYDGVIREINHNSGEVIITATGHDKKVQKSYFIGTVKKIEKDKIKLDVKESLEFPLKFASTDFGGPTFFLKRDELEDVTNKVIIAGEISSYLQVKAEALGVAGFVTLNKLTDTTDVNFAQVKNIADIEKINKSQFSYCLIDQKNSKIILYEN
jgi:hypothetical protein